jgi:hypothetical protein
MRAVSSEEIAWRQREALVWLPRRAGFSGIPWRVLPAAINFFLKSLHYADHHPIRIKDERERLVTASPVTTKSRAPAGGNNYPENGLVKSPRRDTRALSPAGMFGAKAPLRLAAQKSRLHAPSFLLRSAPAYFLCKWGVQSRLD